ncbi:hypothetical protein HK097_007222 [Rhizophlyctis rosea]|uniref:Uncharacterized protein n=1 Tax=Rhizophlyctis rosea TaxID=64517 RepID=A0AAD5SC78_9FUNG|nr:hypothetical protein HK097_007222 [Rhizophlyctis rosea]
MPTTSHFSVTLLDVKNNRRPFPEYVQPSNPSNPSTTSTPTRAVTYIQPQPNGTEFAVRVQNLRLEPVSTASNTPALNINVKNNLCFLIFINKALVYARMMSRVGEVREVDGQRVGEGKMEAFKFGINGAAEAGKPNDIGSVRVEVWNTEVIQKLGGVVPVWPKASKTGDEIKFEAAGIAGPQSAADQANPSAAVICRRVGTQPLATFAIVYDATFFKNSLVPLREAFLATPTIFPNVIPSAAAPLDPFDTPTITTRLPSYTPPSPPRDDFMPGRPKGQGMSVESLTQPEDPKLMVIKLWNHIQRLQDRLNQAEDSKRQSSSMDLDDVPPAGDFRAGPVRSPAAMVNGHRSNTVDKSVRHNSSNSNSNSNNTHIQIHNPVFNLSPPPMPLSPAAVASYAPRSPSPYRGIASDEDDSFKHSPSSSSSSSSSKRRRNIEEDTTNERRKKDKHRKKRHYEQHYGERQRREASPSSYEWV